MPTRTTVLTFILFMALGSVFSQTENTRHSIDSCLKCKCTKYHRTISKDSLTNEKIIVLLKKKGKDCACNIADGHCNYQSITTQYYPDGQIHSKTIEKGLSYGWSKTNKSTTSYYNKSGQLISKTNYINGLKDGRFIEYSSNTDKRILKRKGRYKNDKLHGKVKVYDSNGKLNSKARYKNGEVITSRQLNYY